METTRVFKLYMPLACGQMVREMVNILKTSLSREECFAIDNELQLYSAMNGVLFQKWYQDIYISVLNFQNQPLFYYNARKKIQRSDMYFVWNSLYCFLVNSKYLKDSFVLCNETANFEMLSNSDE